MGCASSSVVPTPYAEEKALPPRDLKILLLGSGESGKSTMFFQLKRLFQPEIDQFELERLRDVLRENALDAIRVLVREAKKEEKYTNDDVDIEAIGAIPANEFTITSAQAELIARLWKTNPRIQKMYERRDEFYHYDATAYYLDNVLRFADEKFVPTALDMIQARTRTTGVIEFAADTESYKMRVIDVGGQKSERKKWVMCFDHVQAIVWVCNLTGFAKRLFEDAQKRQIEEDLPLFESIVTKDAIRGIPVFLVLNKKDLFAMARQTTDLRSVFSDYQGDNSMDDFEAFLVNKFRTLVPSETPFRSFTISATNANEVDKVIRAVKTTVGGEADS